MGTDDRKIYTPYAYLLGDGRTDGRTDAGWTDARTDRKYLLNACLDANKEENLPYISTCVPSIHLYMRPFHLRRNCLVHVSTKILYMDENETTSHNIS
jgi:hypothetical protein